MDRVSALPLTPHFHEFPRAPMVALVRQLGATAQLLGARQLLPGHKQIDDALWAEQLRWH